MPRIIAGSRRSIILHSPQSDKVRPTNDRTKESLFNILNARYPLEEGKILDLFAGTGSLGLEGLSRGASFAYFVDLDTKLLKLNIEKCKFFDQSQVLQMSWQRALEKLKDKKDYFTHIFLDPPYDKQINQSVIENDIVYDIMKKNCVIIAEISNREIIDSENTKLILVDKRQYGSSVFAFYTKGDL